MTLCLLIDTTIQGVAVGLAPLCKGAELLWSGVAPQNENSSSLLSSLMKEAFEKTDEDLSAVSALVVSVGPGSFTGIKVGLAYAHGLMRAAKKPIGVLEVSSFEALARFRAKTLNKKVALFLPATRNQGFFACSDDQSSSVESIFLDKVTPDFWPKLRHLGEIALLKPWPLLTQSLSEKHISFNELGISHVCAQADHGMWGHVQSHWSEGFRQELPRPKYMRQSTAEEQIRR